MSDADADPKDLAADRECDALLSRIHAASKRLDESTRRADAALARVAEVLASVDLDSEVSVPVGRGFAGTLRFDGRAEGRRCLSYRESTHEVAISDAGRRLRLAAVEALPRLLAAVAWAAEAEVRAADEVVPEQGPEWSAGLTARSSADALRQYALDPVESLEGLPEHIVNILHDYDVLLVGQLVQRTERDLLRMRRIGRKSLKVLREPLRERGLDLNMQVDEETMAAISQAIDAKNQELRRRRSPWFNYKGTAK